MLSMASRHFCARYNLPSSPQRTYGFIPTNCSSNLMKPSTRSSSSSSPAVLLSSSTYRVPSSSYNTLVFQAVRLLGPPARFEASKLKVVFQGEETDKYARILPRSYSLSHCDFTANLTLTISNVINHDQLKGWYNEDDVVAQWTEVNGDLCLDVHCFVSGPNSFLDLAAEFRYHIFSKELPLVLKAVLHGDYILFREHQELMDAAVRVYFHSSSKKYNRLECWGTLKDAADADRYMLGRQGEEAHGLLTTSMEGSNPPMNWGIPKSIFQALFTFLL